MNGGKGADRVGRDADRGGRRFNTAVCWLLRFGKRDFHLGRYFDIGEGVFVGR
jgi:hypothetical protein